MKGGLHILAGGGDDANMGSRKIKLDLVLLSSLINLTYICVSVQALGRLAQWFKLMQGNNDET
jgi:hypothetical protein